MSYINQGSSITVDAILTRKGKELAAQGKLKITKFALGDDEIDYSLWDPTNSGGSNYYGEKIENQPIMEASPDETKNMVYMLTSLDKDQIILSTIINTQKTMEFASGRSLTLTPQSSNGTSEFGYTLTIPNGKIFTIQEIGAVKSGALTRNPTSQTSSIQNSSLIASGMSFLITAKILQTDTTVNATVYDNLTGASQAIVMTVKEGTVKADGSIG